MQCGSGRDGTARYMRVSFPNPWVLEEVGDEEFQQTMGIERLGVDPGAIGEPPP